MMGTECVSTTMLNHDTDPAIPPGFGPFASFSLGATQDSGDHTGMTAVSSSTSDSVSVTETGNQRKSRRNRRSVDYSQFNDCTEDYTQDLPSGRSLPKGVLRGCAECLNCQKVLAKWKPDSACRPAVDEAPVFYPTEEEFKDTLKYIESIRTYAEPYGICRIVPPWSWRPPCQLKAKNIWENSKFATRVQRLDKLQNRETANKSCQNQNTMRKRRKLMETGSNQARPNPFGFEPGPEFTLETFKKYADDFRREYFGGDSNPGFEPSVEIIEGEYWRIVEKPTAEMEVLYGADLETGSFGSGFPKASTSNSSETDDEYVKSGWNLNNFPKLPGSVLSFEGGDISGVLVPWLYVGMCFSSFCWHVEDHHLYSLNYMHWGAPKVWYGVPGNDAPKLEAAMKKYLPDLFDEQPDLLHNLVTQFSPSLLKQEGVPVYRSVQREGEFVITFPRAYHAGFNCGFNCAEAVNVAPVDWLPHGQNAVELYREQARKISVSHDKLLLGASREAVRAQWEIMFTKNKSEDNLRWKNASGPNGILSKALKERIGIERERRENLCNTSQPKKMDPDFDSTDRECVVCHYDLHLSAAGCTCNPDRFACLLHAKDLCTCDWSTRFFLFRYDITELNILADAVSGKLSAVHRWGLSHLRLSLSSCISKGNSVKEEVKKEAGKDAKLNVSKIEVKSLLNNNGAKKEGFKITEHEQGEKVVTKIENKPTSLLVAKDSCSMINNLPSSITQSQQMEEQCKSSGSSPTNSLSQSTSLKIDKETVPSKEIKRETVQSFAASTITLQNPTSSNVDNTLHHACMDIVPVKEDPKLSDSSQLLDAKLAIATSNSTSECTTSESASNTESMMVALSCKPDMRWIRKTKGGPRVANVVRKSNYTVEPLEYGIILSGNKWCTDRVIYPRGFKSRVRYLSVLDPTQMCYYISEILDGGDIGPLFMVMVEECRNEVFIHVSAMRCWDMVRERVNMEIRKQHIKGKVELTILQPPGTLDGLEMFGLTSPNIVKAIEVLDRDHMCTAYWSSRPNAQQTPAISSVPTQNEKSLTSISALEKLLTKANLEEVQALRSILYNEIPQQEALLLINKQIERFPS
ncbi:Transcription factor jumonji (jmj) family protein / zinc finger (C5HC2 type) family protein [Rhynchospora pubera]|uniref:Transcription factor jumonji (Jmj) family protein / zinc finger (C5HC2 type) family protein n=1 Tax=Rhynchospora pubera TaxID=906938 RepID=A0AAV8EAG7_9POAL|nr:Transcription factor jumonji (jmj) family protein / zinc finger (C5HC2 type) family protein [Rhynchospora pubera]